MDWRTVLAEASVAGVSFAPKPLSRRDPGLIGPYAVEAVLGQGGMGRVYLARDAHSGGRPVALKVLTRSGDATAWTRFQREFEAARRVTGEGTARVVDGDPNADPPWMATEYIAGPTLDSLVAECGPLSMQATAALALGVAEALASIHASGVVHRDLKPANVILSADGPRVVDFGIARTDSSATLSVTGWTMGTPGYMAPEQIASPREVGPAADVFALGAILVFASTGSGPYAGGDPSTVVYRVVHGDPELGAVPAPLRELVEPCVRRNPGERPGVAAVAATARSLVERLGERPATLPLISRPVPVPVVQYVSPEPPVDPFSVSSLTPKSPQGGGLRRRGRPAVLAALAAAIAVMGVGGWFGAHALAHPSASPSPATGTATAATAATGGAGQPSASGGSPSTTARAAAFTGGTVLVGPGCPASPWATFSITSGSLERNVGAGDPSCGGQADAFRKSGNIAESGSNAQWIFYFGRSVACAMKVYIADSNPSSGKAVYLLTAGQTQRFSINQFKARGTLASEPDLVIVSAPNGEIDLMLTDIADAASDHNHVTASAVMATCRTS